MGKAGLTSFKLCTIYYKSIEDSRGCFGQITRLWGQGEPYLGIIQTLQVVKLLPRDHEGGQVCGVQSQEDDSEQGPDS